MLALLQRSLPLLKRRRKEGVSVTVFGTSRSKLKKPFRGCLEMSWDEVWKMG